MTTIKTRLGTGGQFFEAFVEREYGPDDAYETFRKNVHALGGHVVMMGGAPMSLVVRGLSEADAKRLTRKLTEDLEGMTTPLDRSLKAFYERVKKRRSKTTLGEALNEVKSSLAYVAETLGTKSSPQSSVVDALVSDNALFRELVFKPAPKLRVVECLKHLEGREYLTDLQKRLALPNMPLSIVGTHHRTLRQFVDRQALAGKYVGNMVLVVREFDNSHDRNALIVLVWDWSSKCWRFVGYVRATQAKTLADMQVLPYDQRVVMVGKIVELPVDFDGHREGNNVKFVLTGELREYPKFSKAIGL